MGTNPEILCCICGALISSNQARMCVNCLKTRVDITEGVQKQMVIHSCRDCQRWYRNPGWLVANLESMDLLSLCLKKIKGLQKVKLVNARFLYSEEHSRHLRIECTVQKEVFGSVILQQSFVCEAHIQNMQCEQCTRVSAKDTWNALVQLRQPVEHKRTIFLLEQLILKHRAHQQCSNIKDDNNGLDFFFQNRSHGQRFVDFVEKSVPCRLNTSKRLISADANNNTYNYKYTYCLHLPPICRDDLVVLPSSLAHNKGHINPIVVCKKIGKDLHFVDPQTGNCCSVSATEYFRHNFHSVANNKQFVEYTVLETEIISQTSNQKGQIADVTLMRTLDLGRVDTQFIVRSHLGALLHAGDLVLGYEICSSNFAEEDMAALGRGGHMPEILLVKKVYALQPGRRIWKLETLPKEMNDNSRRSDAREQHEYELFMREVESSRALRKHLNLYKDPQAILEMQEREARGEVGDSAGEGLDPNPEAVDLAELLDGLQIDDPGTDLPDDADYSEPYSDPTAPPPCSAE
eukprot:gnl/Spiro4/4280_TR2151_c0_g3_i1.p1 gnl/Spiro4/4280_TR2151_c0_g3~~gnl/Spiro4/4280_TR2151_c0_g3_i1.p1  ORF type:complete len:545 (-),score=89.95 gnl/Spiro4/4280_TR2151_c0_g3_i1:41-1597(-)